MKATLAGRGGKQDDPFGVPPSGDFVFDAEPWSAVARHSLPFNWKDGIEQSEAVH